jgi:hypothetical protein
MSLIAETQDNVDEDAVESEEMREPKHWRNAIKVPQWRESMQREIDSLVRRETLELVDRRKANRIMKSVWASNSSAMRELLSRDACKEKELTFRRLLLVWIAPYTG